MNTLEEILTNVFYSGASAGLRFPQVARPGEAFLDRMETEIKSLFLDLTEPHYTAAYNRGDTDPVFIALVELRKQIKEL